MKIAIKKISSKASVQPINIPTITAEVIESTLEINRSTNDEQQDRFELQAVQSHSQIINVAPLRLEEQRAESLDNVDMIQSMNMPRENGECNLQILLELVQRFTEIEVHC